MDKPLQFVIIQERSAGNEQVGDMWLETRTFPPEATLQEVWQSLGSRGSITGRTMIRPDESKIRHSKNPPLSMHPK